MLLFSGSYLNKGKHKYDKDVVQDPESLILFNVAIQEQ